MHAEVAGYVCAAEAVRRAQTGRGRVAAGSACAMWPARYSSLQLGHKVLEARGTVVVKAPDKVGLSQEMVRYICVCVCVCVVSVCVCVCVWSVCVCVPIIYTHTSISHLPGSTANGDGTQAN